MKLQLSDKDTIEFVKTLLEDLDMDEMKKLIEAFSFFRVTVIGVN